MGAAMTSKTTGDHELSCSVLGQAANRRELLVVMDPVQETFGVASRARGSRLLSDRTRALDGADVALRDHGVHAHRPKAACGPMTRTLAESSDGANKITAKAWWPFLSSHNLRNAVSVKGPAAHIR